MNLGKRLIFKTSLKLKDNQIAYVSDKYKTATIASNYSRTRQSLYRQLAYNDLPYLISKYVNGNIAVDYGCGTGISTQFIKEQGFKVIGFDVSKAMLDQAKNQFPDINFALIRNGRTSLPSKSIDFIFSSFVLFEISSKAECVNYLKEAARIIKYTGIFILITGSEDLYRRNWRCLNVNYPQNKNLKSGDRARLSLPNERIEFIDFFWTLSDYELFFAQAGLTILEKYYPLGKPEESIWKDEKKYSPYIIFISKLT